MSRAVHFDATHGRAAERGVARQNGMSTGLVAKKLLREQTCRFINATVSALRSSLLTIVPTPICVFKLFPCRAHPGIPDRLTRKNQN